MHQFHGATDYTTEWELCLEDGGYYAIKGFDFQIDKTILELFDENNLSGSVAIEQIQDINTDDFVLQVKYKETQEFATSKIRDPVVQLIKLFTDNPGRRKYILYCHFKDRLPGPISFDESGIDEILKIKLEKDSSDAHKEKFASIQKIDQKTREEFAKHFILQFAEDYDSQFSRVIAVLVRQQFCRHESEAIFFYAYIADYLRKIVVTNTDISKRTCERKKLIHIIESGQRLMFDLSFEEYASRKDFIEFLKQRVQVLRANQKNCLIFGAGYSGTWVELSSEIDNFLSSYYDKPQYNLEPPLVVLQDNICRYVKRRLIELGYIINDGFEEINFRADFLLRTAISTRKLVGKNASDSLGDIGFKLRVASASKISSIASTWRPNKVMYFGSPEVDEWKDLSMFLIQKLNFGELPQIVKVRK